jgi:hypothetical protein
MRKTRKNYIKKGGQRISVAEIIVLINQNEDIITSLRTIYKSLDKDKYYIITDNIKTKIQQLYNVIVNIRTIFNNAGIHTGGQLIQFPIKTNAIAIPTQIHSIITNNLNIIGRNANNIQNTLRNNINLINAFTSDNFSAILSLQTNIISDYFILIGFQLSSLPAPRAASPAPRAASPAPRAASPAPRVASPAPRAASP